MKSQRERDAEKRAQKLRDVDEAVADGRLLIRQMTVKERAQFPAQTPRPGPPRRK